MTRSSVSYVFATSVLGLIVFHGPPGAGAAPGTAPAAAQALPATGFDQTGAVGVKHTLTLEGADRVLAAAIAEARRRNAGGAIAVVDEGGALIAFWRLDGTFTAGATVSIGKARTAATFKKPTRVFEESIKNGRIALVGVGEMTPLQGGVPIEHDGQVIGAIGVSGAHTQVEDEEIALAGAAGVASLAPAAPK
jgi:glc operon protein GlcG